MVSEKKSNAILIIFQIGFIIFGLIVAGTGVFCMSFSDAGLPSNSQVADGLVIVLLGFLICLAGAFIRNKIVQILLVIGLLAALFIFQISRLITLKDYSFILIDLVIIVVIVLSIILFNRSKNNRK